MRRYFITSRQGFVTDDRLQRGFSKAHRLTMVRCSYVASVPGGGIRRDLPSAVSLRLNQCAYGFRFFTAGSMAKGGGGCQPFRRSNRMRARNMFMFGGGVAARECLPSPKIRKASRDGSLDDCVSKTLSINAFSVRGFGQLCRPRHFCLER